jgi:uncharacterized membrane protein YhaH (DUF805 family)
MDFAQAIKSGVKNYAVFGGVASRSEFWFWILFTQLVSAGLSVVSSIVVSFSSRGNLDGVASSSGWAQTWAPLLAAGSESGLSSLWGLAVFVPTLAVSARRRRDAGYNPRLLWLYLVPGTLLVVVAIIAIILLAFWSPTIFCFIDNCSNFNWIAVGLLLLGVLVLSLVLGILFIVWFAQPTKPAEQGNKYVAQQPSMAAPIQPIEPGTTA